MTEAAYWERVLASEGLAPLERCLGYTLQYHEDRSVGPSIGGIILPDKSEDDPFLLDARKEIAALADRLPPRWRTLFLLEARGLTQAAIAQQVGLTQATVGESLRRVRGALRSLSKVRAVTEEDVEEWIQLSPLAWNWKHVSKRKRITLDYLECWTASHAARSSKVPQCEMRGVLRDPAHRLPRHVVSKTLLIIWSTFYIPAGRPPQ